MFNSVYEIKRLCIFLFYRYFFIMDIRCILIVEKVILEINSGRICLWKNIKIFKYLDKVLNRY